MTAKALLPLCASLSKAHPELPELNVIKQQIKQIEELYETEIVHAEVIRKLQQIMGKEGVVADETALLVYECDALSLFKHQPDAVVFARERKTGFRRRQVANEYSIPFLPRGSGTGLSGGAMAAEGGIIIEMQRMNKILSIDVENRIAVVQPGVVNLHITQAASPLGLYYAPDPSSQMACSIGGNVAENAGGPHCLKYGMTTNHILEIEAVLSDGEIVRLGNSGWRGRRIGSCRGDRRDRKARLRS